MENVNPSTYGIYALGSPIEKSSNPLKRFMMGKGQYHVYLGLVNESSHRVVSEIHFISRNDEGKRPEGLTASIHNALNYYACRLGVQDAFRKVSAHLGTKQYDYNLTADIRTKNSKMPRKFPAVRRFSGTEQEMRQLWDNVSCRESKTLSSLQVAFRPTGTASKPAINCRTGVKFILERMKASLPIFAEERHNPRVEVGRDTSELHHIFRSKVLGVPLTQTVANDDTYHPPARAALHRALG